MSQYRCINCGNPIVGQPCSWNGYSACQVCISNLPPETFPAQDQRTQTTRAVMSLVEHRVAVVLLVVFLFFAAVGIMKAFGPH